MRLYAARHGQTAWNAEDKVCGSTDLPLTEVGIAQAEKLAEKAKELNLDLIISSDLIRARKMAQVVSDACGVPVIEDPRLEEQHFGSWEGIGRKDPRFLERKRQFAMPYEEGGESIFQLVHRVYSALDDITARYADKNVLIVCHGTVCRVIRTYFVSMTNEEYYHYSPDNAAVQEYIL